MHVRSLLLACTLLFSLTAAACKDGETEQNPTDLNPPPNDTVIIITIFGSGSVRYSPQPALDCVHVGDDPWSSLPCDAVTFHDGTGSVDARPAKGWRFDKWTLTLDGISIQKNLITDPANPTQYLLQGVKTALTAHFVPVTTQPVPVTTGPGSKVTVNPIQATFIPQLQSTTYDLDITNPDADALGIEWSGPNCGDFSPRDPFTDASVNQHHTMTWHHPHPDCSEGTDHSDVTVLATIKAGTRTIVCRYQGAQTNTGPVCTDV